MDLTLASADEMRSLAACIGECLRGGEVIELTGDVGSGKTTFTKGLAVGLGVEDEVQSPSFTISRVYQARDGLTLAHYDFYRLPDPGIMSYDIAESAGDAKTITVVEWGETVARVLPEGRSVIRFAYGPNGDERIVTIQSKVTEIGEACAAWTKNR